MTAHLPVPEIDWIDLSGLLPRSDGWMHSGVAVSSSGTIYCAHPDGRALMVLRPNSPPSTISVELTELHGIALTDSDAVLAVADPGHRFDRADHPGIYRESLARGRVALIDAETGRVLQEIVPPALPEYVDQTWRPTSVAVSENELWVADGYGASLVHRFDAQGNHLASFDGAATGSRFDCPHGIILRRGDDATEVVVADRGNHRIVVMSLDGTIRRLAGAEQLDSPSAIALLGEDLYVTELYGGVARFDGAYRYSGRLESRRARSHDEPGWPNCLDADGVSLLPPPLRHGQLNSPHGICAHKGSLYLTEWVIGGRLVQIPSDALETGVQQNQIL